MLQQTRIDQFYKAATNKRKSSGTKEKRNSEDSNLPRTQNRKRTKKTSRSRQVQAPKPVDVKRGTTGHTKFDEIILFDDVSDIELSQVVDEVERTELLSQEVEHVNCTPPKDTDDKNELSPVIKSVINTPKKDAGTVARNHSSDIQPNVLDSPSNKSFYSPKTASQKSPSKCSPKKLFGRRVDNDLVIQAMEQLNLAKQGAIPPNNFDLDEIYSQQTFNYQYGDINSKASTKYELHNVTESEDLNTKILMTTIFVVFSKPLNCGYFSEDELDFIYSIITLPVQAQMLLARMLKRKRTWYRKISINYPEIASDLEDTFNVLVSRSICTFGINSRAISTMLELLNVQEVRKICQKLKLDCTGKKEENIKRLLKFSNTKSLFPGIKSPHAILNSLISETLGYCIRLTEKTWSVMDRILTLLIPNQDPENTVAKTFFMLFDVYQGKLIYPKMPAQEFPIFSSKDHLNCYVEARNLLHETLTSIQRKDWDVVKQCGNLALERLPTILRTESKGLKNSTLPMHVRHFMPGYVWLKVLSKTVDAFKKSANTKSQAVEVLNLLINQDCHMENRKGRWYAELALIEMFHHKNLEASAHVTIQALKMESLTHVDKIDLLGRANKIMKRNGVSRDIKASIREVIDSYTNRIMPLSDAPSNVIDAALVRGNTVGSKSTWLIDTSTDDKSYGSVELIALHHYCNEEYSRGLHCEGALPVTLFFTLFWEEIFDIPVPGAYVTEYQIAPQDLYTNKFYENRKERLDMKLEIIYSLDSESLAHIMENKFNALNYYQSPIQTNLFNSSSHLKELVHCLGVEGVLGICKRLIDNFTLWQAGFPDLIVWNFYTKKCKVVEVKGPGDILSTKQRLWLDYLRQLGLDTEVCLVQDKHGTKRSKRHVDDD